MRRFFRFFFAAMLFASLFSWLYFGYVRASRREAILVEDKYRGIGEKGIIRPSEFSFVASRIFPGRVTLHRVRLFPRSLRIAFRRGLDQSEILGLDDAFYIRANIRVNYKLRVDNLLILFRRLPQLHWKHLEGYLNGRLESFLQLQIGKLYKGDADIVGLKERIQNYFTSQLALKQMNAEFQAEGVHFHSIHVSKVFVPDLASYRSILAAGSEITKQKLARIGILDRALAQRDAANITNTVYFSRLEKIGQLLKKYPHLRDYLAVDRLGKNVEVMVMPYQRWFPPAFTSKSRGQAKGGLGKNKLPMQQTQSGSDSAEALPFAADLLTAPQEGNGGPSQFSDLTPP